MKKSLLIIFCLFCAVTSWQNAKASHIVGGEMCYVYLGNDEYQVTLKVYRDCFNGQAAYDNPTYITIFDGNNNLYGSPIPISFPGSDTLNNDPGNPCLIIPPGICVEEADFITTVTLPPGNGYTMVYERCCRNYIIANIDYPDSHGAVYGATVPDSSLAIGNSSPCFNNFPPTLICVDQPFSFDHSATDPDGDSLVYHLCAAFDGGIGNVYPVPANPPPYSFVPYLAPYTYDNPMGGNPPMEIDPVTGLLTVTPNTIGNFVVAVCVDEYRNGEFLGEHKRDFQFNVVQCVLQVVAAIPNVINNCSDYTVFFENLSVGATYFHWDFGTGNPNDTSNLFQPTFTFPDTGVYTITLYANPGQPCGDTAEATVYIYPTFTAGMLAPDGCDGLPVNFTDASTATFGSIDSWDWSFGDGSTSSSQNPSHTYTDTGTFVVQLIVGTDVGCADTITETITIYPSPTTDILPNDTTICYLDVVQLNASGAGYLNYTWQPNYNLTDPNIPNPVAGPDVTTTYYVTVSNSFGCYTRDSVTITVFDTVIVNAGPDQVICPGDVVQLQGVGGVDFHWSPSNGLSNPNISNPTASPANTTTYTLVSSVGSCTGTDQVTIIVKPVPHVNAGPDKTICYGDSVQLSASGLTTYSWTPNSTLINPETQNPIAFPTSTTTYYVTGTDTGACVAPVLDSLVVIVLPAPDIISSPDTTIILGTCTPDGYLFVTGGGTYQWIPPTGLNDPTSATPVACPTQSTCYVIDITTVDNCLYFDTVCVDVNPEPLVIFPTAFSPNQDGKNDYFRPVILGLASIDVFRIYNRWGEVVFETGHVDVTGVNVPTSDLALSWDGNYKNEKQPLGVYVYFLAGTGAATGTAVERKGNFTLVR